MDNQDKNTFKELLPVWEKIAKRSEGIKELEQRILREQEAEEKDSLKIIYTAMLKQNYESLMDCSTRAMMASVEAIKTSNDSIEQTNELCDKLHSKLIEEREEHENFYNDFCLCMIVDPKGTMETILSHIERTERIRDQTGQSWQWAIGFPLIARLRMAFRLISGLKITV